MDIANLTFRRTKCRRGYDGQEVDQLLRLIAADLALPLGERTLRPEHVTSACFKATQFRAGYDELGVDRALSQLAVELGLPSPAELRDAPSPMPVPAPPFASPVVTAPPTAPARPTDDFRPDPTF